MTKNPITYATLADLIEGLKGVDPDVFSSAEVERRRKKRKKEVISAVKRIGEALDSFNGPDGVFIDQNLNDRVARLKRNCFGKKMISKGTLNNFVSSFSQARKIAAADGSFRIYRENRFSLDWIELHKAISPAQWIKISSLARYMNWKEMGPQEMTDEIFKDYIEWRKLEKVFKKSSLRCLIEKVLSTWNNLGVAQLPKVGLSTADFDVAKKRLTFSVLKIEKFPASFQEDVRTYQKWGNGIPVKPYKAKSGYNKEYVFQGGTEKKYTSSILKFATSAVNAGIPISTITDLRALVTYAVFEKAAKRLFCEEEQRIRDNIKKSNGKIIQKSENTTNIISTMKEIAKSYCRMTSEALSKITPLMEQSKEAHVDGHILYNPDKYSVSHKNRQVLEPFIEDESEALAALYAIPFNVFADLEKKRGGKKVTSDDMRWKAQHALCLAILLYCKPLRGGDATKLNLRHHFARNREMAFGTAEKNREGYALRVVDEVQSLFGLYVEHYRFHRAENDFLFPGRGKDANTGLISSMVKLVDDTLGLDFHAHIIRHIAAFIVSGGDPKHLEAVRHILGHRSSNTTLKYMIIKEEKAEIHVDKNLIGIGAHLSPTAEKLYGAS